MENHFIWRAVQSAAARRVKNVIVAMCSEMANRRIGQYEYKKHSFIALIYFVHLPVSFQ